MLLLETSLCILNQGTITATESLSSPLSVDGARRHRNCGPSIAKEIPIGTLAVADA